MKFFNSKFLYNSLLLLFLIPFIYYTLTKIVQPNLKVTIDSNVKSELQIFYKIDGAGSYSEKYQHNKNIIIGQNKLIINFPYYKDTIRLDIANAPYDVQIRELSLNYFFYSMPFEVNEAQMYQIDSIAKNKDAPIKIVTNENATDPQIFFKLDSLKFENIYIFMKFIFAILIFCIILFIRFNLAKIKKLITSTESSLINLYHYISSLNVDFSKFGIYFLIGFVFHIFEISNFLISVDDEYSAFRITPEAWIWDGRWTGYLIEKFIFDQPTMPFIPNIISCALMALSYIILLRAHNLPSNWKTYFLFPIFSAFPTLWMINEFYGNMVMVAFGFLLVSLSVLMFLELGKSLSENKFSIWSTIKTLFYPALFLSFAIGAYQSFVMLAIALILGVLLLKLFKNDVIDKEKYLINSAFYITYGIALYAIINKIFKIFFPTDSKYIGGFIKIDNIDLVAIANFVYNEMLKVYTGSSDFFGSSISSLWVLILIVLLNISLNNKNRFLSIMLALLVLISPFLLHFLSGGYSLPTRSMVAIPYVVWLFTLLAVSNRNYLTNIIGIIIVGFLLIQQSSTLGQYAAATEIGQSHDRALASDLYKRMSEANPSFNSDDIHYIDVYGFKSIETVYPNVPTSTINASFFDWDGGNMSRIIRFMQLIGYSNIAMVDKESIEKNIVHFNKMPAYPNKGSVQYMNGMYLIKLGSNPDVYRRK